MLNSANQQVLVADVLSLPISSNDLERKPIKPQRGLGRPDEVRAARPQSGRGAVAFSAGKGNGKGRKKRFVDYVSCCKPEKEIDMADAMEMGLAGEFVDLSHQEASQNTDTVSENSNPSCPAPPPSPIHRSRHQRQPTPNLLPDPMGLASGTTHREEVVTGGETETTEPSQSSGLLARVRHIRSYLRDLRSKKGRKSNSSKSKAGSSYATSPREVSSNESDGVSVLSISLENTTQHPMGVDSGCGNGTNCHFNPGPSCQTGEKKDAWRKPKEPRAKRVTKEGDRWKAVEASYSGRYTSKVTPLQIAEEIPGRESKQRPLYRENDVGRDRSAASFNFAAAQFDSRVRRIGKSSSTPESRLINNPQTSSVPSVVEACSDPQLPPGVLPGSPASWAITDWTTRKSSQPSSSSHAPGLAKAQSSGSNGEQKDHPQTAFAKYHQNGRRATMSNSAESSNSVCHDPGTATGTGRPADDVKSDFELRQADGFKKTHRIIHVKPFSPKPSGSS